MMEQINQGKPMDWFLYDRFLRHERVKGSSLNFASNIKHIYAN